MANTISLITYANTFSDWVVVTDGLVNEVNTLGSGNYTKNSGLLTLAGANTGLQVTNNAIIQGGLIVQGLGNSLQVSHDAIITGNLSVGGNVTFTGFEVDYNDITSNTIHANTITVNTTLIGTNSLLNVASDLIVTGNLSVSGNTSINLNEIVVGSLSANSLSGNANSTIFQGISDSQNTSISTALAFSIALG